MDSRDPLLGHDGPVLGGRPDTVGRDGPLIPHAVLIQDLDGREAVMAPLAGLMLRAGLGDMHMHPQPLLPGKGRHPLPHRGAGGIFSMDGCIHQNLAAVVAVPIPGQLPQGTAVVVGLGVKRVGEEHPAAAQVGADAGLGHPLGNDPGAHIHIGNACHA